MIYKPCIDLLSLLVSIHHWKDISIDFIIELPISTNWKTDNYDSILVIIDWLTKMIHYEPVKIIIDTLNLMEVTLDIIVQHHGLFNLIVSDWGMVFSLKFWSFLYYFLSIKQRLFTVFYPETDGQTKKKSSTIEVYFRAFINFEQNDWAKLLPMAEFAYNNKKNTNTGQTSFELNCGYHPCIFYKKNIDPHFKLTSANELQMKLQKLMSVYRESLYYAQNF